MIHMVDQYVILIQFLDLGQDQDEGINKFLR